MCELDGCSPLGKFRAYGFARVKCQIKNDFLIQSYTSTRSALGARVCVTYLLLHMCV